MTGINLYQDRLVVRHDNYGSLTNANLDTADNNADTDISAIYSVSGSNLTLASGKSLFIPASHTFAPGGNITVGGNFTNNGTFTAGTNIFTLNGTSQTIKGTTTFNNFTINAPNTVTFTSGTTQTFNGTFTCTGTAGNIITLTSSTTSAHTLSKSSGTVNCDYISVSYSTATGGATWNPGTNSTDGGNNIGWNITTVASSSGSNIVSSGSIALNQLVPQQTPLPSAVEQVVQPFSNVVKEISNTVVEQTPEITDQISPEKEEPTETVVVQEKFLAAFGISWIASLWNRLVDLFYHFYKQYFKMSF